MSEIVSTNWLYKNSHKKNLVIFDCSWYMPSEKRNPFKEYQMQHIKNSYFFDINDISKSSSSLPHMLPSLKKFKEKIKNFNIHSNSIIINYGKENIMGACRVWWMFKYFGFNNVKVLNGSLSKWKKENKITTKKISKKYKTSYNFKIIKELLSKKSEILNSYLDKNYLIFDARNSFRFKGLINEPRKNLRSGHIPNSQNIYWKKLLKKNSELKNKRKIMDILKSNNFFNKKVICSCGSGISACVLSLSLLNVLGIKSSVYDGSWSEWGLNKNLPINISK